MAKTNRSSNAGVTSDALPESRRFGGGGDEGCPDSLCGLHLNDIPCEELPPSVWPHLTADRTDEGIKLAQQGAGGARVGRSETEGRMAARADGLKVGMQPWEAPDVLKEAASVLPPGMRPKFINEQRAKRGEASSRGFQIVKNEDGDPIRVGDLVLAAMPEENAIARNAHYRGRAQQIAKTSDVEVARGASKFGRNSGVEFSENGSGGRSLGEAVIDADDAQPGDFGSDSKQFEA